MGVGQQDLPSPRCRAPSGAQVDDDRRRVQGAGARVPGHLDLEDPLPRGPEAPIAAAHARRLPALQPPTTSCGCARSCASSATSSCPCASSGRSSRRGAARPRRSPAAPATPGAGRRRALGCRSGPARCARSRTCSGDHGRHASAGRQVEDFGVVKGEVRGGAGKVYDDTDREIVRAVASSPATASAGATCACSHLGRPRVGAAAADAGAVAALAEPRAAQEAVEALENLATVASHLKHLLLVRDLRRIVRLV